MAGVSPTSLDEYCKKFEISFFDVKLPCLFCNFPLTLQDLASFATKLLSLVYRGDKCFACCTLCLKLSAKYERENYLQCVVEGRMLENLLNIPLSQILVRCLYCYKKLDFIEKVDCCIGDLPFCLVRCHWRNTCRFCRNEK
ncbi:E6 [Gammapapillomavirus 22]|uniref:Protein E6 n=2 Tax=Papillomaviridae TaxID=151340 RepID=A0A385PI62_9PAPI|nr:E6 [Gammapapillomavirus 22]AYA93388.1 MAG: E6 protein [Human papillomavirus]